MVKPVKAVGLLSGGLDSTIAAAMLMRQGIEVQGLTFYTGFWVVEHNRRSKTRKRNKPVRNDALQAGAKLDLPVAVSYTHLRAHETRGDLVWRLVV